MSGRDIPLSEALIEVSSGVGASWSKYPVLGATRAGLALAKEPVGKSPERYKLVEPWTIFYNPMRILLGSIAMVEEGGEPGITSPDYVVFRTRPGVLHPRWFYYWLHSDQGANLIRSLTRGAVRERLLFKRLAKGSIRVPCWEAQLRAAEQLAVTERARAAAAAQLEAARALPAAYLREVFESTEARKWPTRKLGTVSLRITDGTHQPPQFTRQGVPFLFVRNIVKGFVDFDVDNYVSEETFAGLTRRCRPERGDVLFSAVGSFGVAVVVETDQPFSFQRHIAHLKVNRDVLSPEFLALFLNSPLGKKQSEAAALGGAQRTVTLGSLSRFSVPVPDMKVQLKVVHGLKHKIRFQEGMAEALSNQADAFDNLVPATLRASFSEGALGHQ